ncbi:Alpha/Beta hydrolase protein [Zychaea mexicana]|uniref:Alpha/Beta hydrolase protein n=1 Tax=Zychaea mexicana TaxID=64656 RepID=UPI0022FEFD65|nr:Alpha/Beta hydrolase protein [Zychaea mexicana]KAI9492342.1 Alpha/Beta hydrolase protein [Zychaea mexicana]
MLDHLVGKPSANWKRTQVLLTLIFGLWALMKGKTQHLPRTLQKINRLTAGRSPWKIALGSWMSYYLLQNLFLLFGLNAPEPLTRLYKRSFYRATWILTALDAGFFTAMPLRPIWLRHFCSVFFSFYYLIFADAAEERVRRVRATISIDHMRTSWEKVANNPILRFFSRIQRPRVTIHKTMRIERSGNNKNKPATEILLMYAGDVDTLEDQTTILLQFPGGGFVSMPPSCHEDALSAWAKQTQFPVVSVNYRKAPEYTYPWPVEECFDFYTKLSQSRGRIIGLSGRHDIKVIIVGDSAGGNLAAAVTLKILSHNQDIKTRSALKVDEVPQSAIQVPDGLVLIYPALDFEMTCWMTPAQLSLLRSHSTTSMIRSKSLQSLLDTKDHLSHASPLSMVPDVEKVSLWKRALGMTPMQKSTKQQHQAPIKEDFVGSTNVEPSIVEHIQDMTQVKHAWGSASIAMTSRMCYFNDRIITADMMRAMAILYLGPHATPDFESDYLLSPVVAPLDLLAQFPKTYMLCGEKDPFVDDTVIFGGRIRKAKHQECRRREEHDLPYDPLLDDSTIQVQFLEGMSHAFLQMMAFLPEAHRATKTIGDWVLEMASPTTEDSSLESVVSDAESSSTISVDNNGGGTITGGIGSPREDTPSPTTARSIATHLAEIVTSEKDMMSRRKSDLVSELFTQKI